MPDAPPPTDCPPETAIDDDIARDFLRRSMAPGIAGGGVGRTIDRKYVLLRLLGKGGMGEVYEARHTGTGQGAAVKLIHRRLLARGEEAESRFRREAYAAGALFSPHIVDVQDSGEDAETGDLYLVMELLHGEDLQHLVDRVGPLLPDVALRIAAQALTGLAKAHEAGIVHRDIKPANLFLARGEGGLVTVKVLDFGIAKVAHDALQVALTSGLTRTDGLLGSPLYMSPEQMENSKGVDHRTDLWSLGSALYCALAGRAPYKHVENVFELLPAVRAGKAPPLRAIAPWVPASVADVVRRALAVAPEERYPSAAAMLEAVRALVPGETTLREEMLTGVPAEVRAAAALVVDDERPRGGTTASGEGATLAALDAGDSRVERAEQSLGDARPPSAWARVAVLAAVLLGTGAALRYAILPARPNLPVVLLSPAGTTSRSDLTRDAVPVPPAAPSRRVTLLIAPEDAAVEVDDAGAPVQDGGVEIVGPLGSVHRVRVSKGKDEIAAVVVVTERGAVPPSVELPRLRPATLVRKPPPATSADAKAGDPMREHE